MFRSKKLTVVAILFAAGIGLALVFRRVPSHETGDGGQGATPLITRRLEGGANNPQADNPPGRAAGRFSQPFKVPLAAGGVTAEMSGKAAETPASFHRSTSPLGSLLKPLDGSEEGPQARLGNPLPADDWESSAETGDAVEERSSAAPEEHLLADGDSLAELAERYLGDRDRYLEIFEINQDRLASPDLLPVGTVIRIPSRDGKSLAPLNKIPDALEEAEIPAPLAPLPAGRPDALRLDS